MQQTITRVSNLATAITRLGISLIITFLVVDLIFPGSTGMTANVGAMADSISQKGLAGLVALGVFYVIYTRGDAQSAPRNPV